ncbi:hypothetical protein DIPPA_13632 [Diplonema papillatum]|nr:hypothetical protein DIPPA_13632 [Diplonema papillatum]
MGTLLRRTCPRLSALADPENVYRPPEKKRAFLNLLPLPKYSQKMPPRKQPTTKSWLQALMQPPKPRWYNELSQASLYSSVLRYTQYQLTDEKLFKAEEYKTPHNTSREKIRLRNQINEARVQPAFSELQPEAGWEQRLDDAAAKVGDRFCEMMHDLKSVRPSALPHPGLALYGEQVVKTHLVEFLTDLFPRLQSKHLDDLLHRKFSLSNSVNAAARCGLARGMGMDREHLLYVKVTKVNLDYVKHQADLERGRDEIRRGATTPNLVASHFGRERHKWLWKKLSLSDDESQLLEERMKLLRRHLCAFVAYATLVQGTLALGQSTPENPRERGDAWVHVKDGQIHVDQSRGRYFGIRKQLHYMFGLDEDTLRAYDVNPWMKSRVYRVRTWVRMFMVEHLQHPKVAILDELLTARLSEINHLAKKKKSAARTPWFCIRQVSKMMDERKLAAVFRHDTELREMLADSTDFVNTRVSTSLNPPLGVLLSNFTDVSRQTTAAPAPPPGECPCQRYLLDGYHIQGHACGQAHLLKTSSELISLFDKGRKFRPDGGEEAVCREVDKAVTQFVEEQFKDAPPHFARMLRRKILATVDLSRVGADPELTAGARKKLLELQEHLVILPVDKSSHDFGFVCKRFYNQDLHAKVNHSTNYSPSEETPQQVIARHKAYLGREGLHSSNVLPYLYGTLKLHKEVTSMRYIAGVSRKNCVDSDSEAADAGRDARPKTTFSSTTDAQLDLTGLLKAIMSILRREDDIRFNATGYRYFWITESSDDTAFFLKTHADELAQLDAGTFDFTTMYDQLELEELLNAVADTINEAFAAEAARLNVDAGRLVLTNAKVGDATFLGIRIRHEVSEMSGRRYMRLSVLDKAKAYRYQPLAYTSVLSTAPSNFGSSILIGALVRNGRIANNLHDFKTEMNNTVLKLMRRGYRKSVLKSGFRKWLLDTYPEAKFGDHCEKIRAHFVWLVHEVERILQMPDLESIDQAVERLLAEKAFPKDPPELRCKRCFTDRTKDGRLFRGLRGLRVHERLCTYVNFGE